MNKFKYIGCDSAATAYGKIEVVNPEGNITEKIFFGNEEDMWDNLSLVSGRNYYCYIRNITDWGTGAFNGWQICKSNWG